MADNIIIPIANPLHFTVKNFTQPEQYNSKHITDFQFEDTILPWEQNVQWFQPWQKNDALRLHFISAIGPVNAKFYDQYGGLYHSQSLAQMQQSFFYPGKYIYHLDQNLSIFAEGYYKVEIEFGSGTPIVIESNWIEIKTKHDSTILLAYKHHKFFADCYFENGWSPVVRMYGTLVFGKPGSKNTIFENQEYDSTLVNSKVFNTYTLYTGGPEGIPDWAIIKYNIMLSCSSVLLDGKYYTKATEGANFEKRQEKDYPMKGWSIELRDKLNRSSKLIGADGGVNNLGLSVVITVETKGFVSDDAGGSFFEIPDIE